MPRPQSVLLVNTKCALAKCLGKRSSFSLSGRLRSIFVLFLIFAAVSCERWIPISAPAPLDSAKFGTVRVTKADNRQVILHDAIVSRAGVSGSSDQGITTSIPTDSIKRLDRERGRASQAGMFYVNYLGVVIILAGIASLFLLIH